MRRFKIKSLFGIYLGCLSMLCGLAHAQANKASVVATISIVGDWVRQVGGDDIKLTTLVGPDGDPHEYTPGTDDSRALNEAAAVFEVGAGLESWLNKLFTSGDSRATRIVLSDHLTLRKLPSDEGRDAVSDETDPHLWQNVKNAEVMVNRIRDALIVADSSHADQFNARAADYEAELQKLDDYITQQIQAIPQSRRKLVTTHDAFGYFGERYGIDITHCVLNSVTTEAAEPSARQLADAIEQIKAAHVPVIFLENIENPKLLTQVATEANVTLGPRLFSDALGKADSGGDTYLKMMRSNIDNLVKALRS